MKHLLPLVAFFLGAAPLSASDEVPLQQNIDLFVESVVSGEFDHSRPGGAGLSSAELVAISDLAGCKPSLGDGSHSRWIELDWQCVDRPKVERQTALKMESDGGYSIWINPIETRLAPTEVAKLRDDLPSHRSIARSFFRAIREGNDPTLGGLIPITDEHLSRLTLLKGLRPIRPTGQTRTSQVRFWDAGKGKIGATVVTDLRFDDWGRPVGVILSGTSVVGG